MGGTSAGQSTPGVLSASLSGLTGRTPLPSQPSAAATPNGGHAHSHSHSHSQSHAHTHAHHAAHASNGGAGSVASAERANGHTPTSSRAHGKSKSRQSTNSLPAPPLDDVHAAFVEFRAKEEDKCLSVQCIYCQQVRAKNTSRQRQHLLECPTYLNVMKDSIPANNLQHTFPEGDIARSLQIPAPGLELDFRMSVKLNPSIAVGNSPWGHRDWVSCLGGQWAGRWGKGLILVCIEFDKYPHFLVIFFS